MPARSPFYEFPPFPDMGNEEVNEGLEKWRQEAGNIYTRNLFEAERLPITASTFRVSTAELLTTAQASYVNKKIGLQGGETLVAHANARFLSQGELCQGVMEVTYPNGDTVQLTSALVILQGQTSASYVYASVGNLAIVPPRIQFGGEHQVDLLVSKITTAGTTSAIYAASLVLEAY